MSILCQLCHMSYVIVRFIVLHLNLWIADVSGEGPPLQSTNCMYFNVARIVFLMCMCIG